MSRGYLSREIKLRCRECGRLLPPQILYVCEHCFGPLEVSYPLSEMEITRETFRRRANDLWRYFELLPLENPRNIVSLGAGFTSLIKSGRLAERYGLKNLYLKEDFTNPTHSFKDRPASVAVSKSLEFGLKAVGCASTGNLAAATAAHAAKAGLPCYIFIPSDIEKEKVLQALSYGATLIAVEGTYDEANWLAARFAEEYGVGIVNVNIRPYYVEGSKTLAFEVCEQLGWRLPDHVIVPMASGALLNAIGKGFREFEELGLVEGEVRISGVQPAGCSPIVAAYRRGSGFVTPIEKPDTIAKSLAIGDPGDGMYALRTVRRTGGSAVAVEDDEIVDAIEDLAKFEGLFVEPGGAVTVAAIKKLLEEGSLDKDETVVCYLTGGGLKTPGILADRTPLPLLIKPSMEKLKEVLEVKEVA